MPQGIISANRPLEKGEPVGAERNFTTETPRWTQMGVCNFLGSFLTSFGKVISVVNLENLAEVLLLLSVFIRVHLWLIAFFLHSSPTFFLSKEMTTYWIPAFAGMTVEGVIPAQAGIQ